MRGNLYLPRAQNELATQLLDVSSVLPNGHPELERIQDHHSDPTSNTMSDVRSSLRLGAWIHCAESHSKRPIYLMRGVGIDSERCAKYFYSGIMYERKRLTDDGVAYYGKIESCCKTHY
jgi:hypothetical protein